MRTLVTWNILHGGGRVRMPEIAIRLAEARPDVVVVTEFRPANGGGIRGVLADHGLTFAVHSGPPDGANGVLIAAAEPIVPLEEAPLARDAAERMLAVRARSGGWTLAGVHIPDASGSTARNAVWQRLIAFARAHTTARAAIAGDFNTERPARGRANSPAAARLGTLATLGYADAWAAAPGSGAAGTWSSRTGRARRLDQIWISNALTPALRRCEHLDFSAKTGGPRPSDHAMVVAQFNAPDR